MINLQVPLQFHLDSIYERFHDEVGHPGINTTLDSVHQRYTWVGIFQAVREYVTSFYCLLYTLYVYLVSLSSNYSS